MVSAWYWINATASTTPGNLQIVSHDSNGVFNTRHFQLRWGASDRVELVLFDGGMTVYTIQAPVGAGVARDTWHHVAALWNYPTAGGVYLIVNGETTIVTNATTYNTAGTATQFVVGARYNTPAVYSDWWDGRIAHVWCATASSAPAYFMRGFYHKTRSAFGV
jgi:hypothetical protein